jgi:DNA (cytosine-5)-methyltransferase 1
MPQGLSRFTEDLLIHNTQFICEQIILFDEAAIQNKTLLIDAPCIKLLIDLVGITIQKDSRKSTINLYQEHNDWLSKLRCKQKKSSWIKSTTTQEIYELLERINTFCSNEQDNIDDKLLLKHSIKTNCSKYSACKNKMKSDDPGTSKKNCIKHLCSNITIVSIFIN